ncbi:EamA family transporter [Demequina sp.]|uniref:EamA family transporter n=1 Tax=Demequina sp. TaxID=2050685 RepID=UPI003A87BCC2
MAVLTHDARVTRRVPESRLTSGLAFAALSAASFGVSGSLGRGLLDAGWTPGAATLARVAIAALVLTVPGVLAMRGRWHLLRKGWGVVVAYGVFAVAGAQLCYFFAVGYLDVSIALLIEYLAPVAVVLWMWLRHGNRPTRLTVAGAFIAAAGLALLLDVLGGGGSINVVGVAWALAAMVGASVYFVIGSDESNGLPPIALASGGLLVALVVLGGAALTGVLPIAWTAATVHFVSFTAPWWAVALVLGVISAATAYVAGIAATRRLGARLGSFVALSEVLAATIFAWILLGQVPLPIQVGGALLVVAGVVVVKLGERPAETVAASIAEPPAITDPPAPVPI